MSPEIYTMLGGFATLGLFVWRVTDKLDRKVDHKIDGLASKLDGLAKDHQALARELSELRGEIRGRFGKPEIQPAE